MSAVRRLQLVGIEDERPKGPPAPGVVRVAIATRDIWPQRPFRLRAALRRL